MMGDPTYMGPYLRLQHRGFVMPDIERIDWSLVSSVKASNRRTQVLRALSEKPRMNGELADQLGISTKWAREQVKWLERRDLVEDLTEDKRNYKMYSATQEGEKIAEVL